MKKSLENFIDSCDDMLIIGNDSYVGILNELNRNYTDSGRIALESDTAEDKAYPIFIVLMHSGTALANIIQKVTHDTYSHACISFTEKLIPLYSFGRKKASMAETGFVANTPKDEFFTKFKTRYSVYVIYVTKSDLDSMKSRMDYFIKNADTLKYSVSGLLFNYVKLPNENQKKYFCSRFVADILTAGKLVDRSPSLYRPNDFVNLENVIKVDEGEDFYQYDSKKVKKILNNMKGEN